MCVKSLSHARLRTIFKHILSRNGSIPSHFRSEPAKKPRLTRGDSRRIMPI
jgi:hypothetical protein